MRTQMRSQKAATRLLRFSGVALAACLLAAPAGLAKAAQHDHDQHAQAAAPSGAATTPGTAAKPDMMADMKQADAELKALVNAMNAATGNAKVDAMAKVINALVARHESMQARMAEMRASGGMMPGGQGRGMMTMGGSAPQQPGSKAPDQPKAPDQK